MCVLVQQPHSALHAVASFEALTAIGDTDGNNFDLTFHHLKRRQIAMKTVKRFFLWFDGK